MVSVGAAGANAAPPPAFVVDTSVAVKWFVDEGDSEGLVQEALGLLHRHRQAKRPLIAPDLIVLELISALSRKGMADDDLEHAVRTLVRMELGLVPVSTLGSDSARIVSRCGITPYDAAFAALAVGLGIPLITADRRLADSGACEAVLLGDYEPPDAPPLR